MDLANVQRLRDLIARLPDERVRMDDWSNVKGPAGIGSRAPREDECGTVGCIAGWAAHLATQDLMERTGVRPDDVWRMISEGFWSRFLIETAQEWLGLPDNETVDYLFRGWWTTRRGPDNHPLLDQITRQEVLAELDYILALSPEQLPEYSSLRLTPSRYGAPT